jgi:hypothetical protein
MTDKARLTWDDLTDSEKIAAVDTIYWRRVARKQAAEEAERKRVIEASRGPFERWLKGDKFTANHSDAETFGFSDGLKGRDRFKGPWPKGLKSIQAAYRRGFAVGRAQRF